MTPIEAQQYLDSLVAHLHEFFEVVQIQASWCEEGFTHSVDSGAGNWYARQGMAHEFINKDVAQENARQISEVMPRPPQQDG